MKKNLFLLTLGCLLFSSALFGMKRVRTAKRLDNAKEISRKEDTFVEGSTWLIEDHTNFIDNYYQDTPAFFNVISQLRSPDPTEDLLFISTKMTIEQCIRIIESCPQRAYLTFRKCNIVQKQQPRIQGRPTQKRTPQRSTQHTTGKSIFFINTKQTQQQIDKIIRRFSPRKLHYTVTKQQSTQSSPDRWPNFVDENGKTTNSFTKCLHLLQLSHPPNDLTFDTVTMTNEQLEAIINRSPATAQLTFRNCNIMQARQNGIGRRIHFINTNIKTSHLNRIVRHFMPDELEYSFVRWKKQEFCVDAFYYKNDEPMQSDFFYETQE